MSYCHVGGNGIDFNLGFGPEPGALMRANTASASCLPQCGSGNGGGGCTIFIDNIAVSNATCSDNNGKLVIQTSGGSGSVTYDIGNGQQSSNTFDNLLAGTYQITVTNGAGCERSQEATIQLISTQPGLNATVTNATCGEDDGSVDLAASGGKAPYSYRIGTKTQSSPTFNNLAVGNYTATVTDNEGCSESKQLSIFTDNPPALSASMNHTSCGEENGSVNLSADGGLGPYTYKLGGQTSSNGQFDEVAAGDYQVEVIDGNGCIDDQSITINGSQPIAASANVLDTECGQDNGEVVVTASGGTGSLTYSKGGSFQSVPTFSNLAAGVYQMKVKDATGCVHTFDQQVVSSESFALAPNAEQTTCGLNNGSLDIQIEGNTGPYQYSINQGTFKSSPSFEGLSPGLVSMAVRDTDGCIVEGQIEINASTKPRPIAQIDRTHCGLDNGSINLNVDGGTGPFQFRLGNQFQTDAAFLNLAAGEYIVAVIDEDECQDSIKITIDSSEAVSANLLLTPTACGMPNGAVEFEALSGEGPFAYSVGEIVSDQNLIEGLTPGKYLVKVADADQCSWVDTVDIDASNAISLEAELTMTTCGRDNGQIEFLASGGTGELLFNLRGTNFSEQEIYQALPASTYTMQVQDEEDCLLEKEVTILSSTNPLLDFTVVHTRCGNENGSLILNVSDGEGPFQFQVDQAISDTNTLVGLASGSYQLKVVDLHGCVDSNLAVVETSTAPILSLETSPASCYQPNGKITVGGVLGVGPYQYSIGQDLYQSETSFSAVDSGEYSVVLIDQRACTDTIVTHVDYDAQFPAPELAKATSICESDPATLDIGLLQAPSIVWTRDDTPLDHVEPILTTDVPGAYQVVVKYHDDCILETSTQLDVRSKPAQSLVDADTICLGDVFTIGQPDESLTYQWSNDSEGSSVDFSVSDVYELTVTNTFDCSISKTLDMTVIQPVDLQVDADTSYICLGEGFQWNLSGADQYQWTTADPTIDQTDISNPNVNPFDDQTYQVIGTNQCFEGDIDLSLFIYQDIVEHIEDTTLIEGSPLRFFVDNQAVSANWASPFQLECTDCLETTGRPETSDVVDVIYLDVNGCEFRDTINVDIIPLEEVFPPLLNVITPNDDGLNDVLAFEGMDIFHQYKLEVFNHDGNILYTSKDYQNNWNGTLDGDALPEGVYFYVISVQIDDRIFRFDSDLTIVRD